MNVGDGERLWARERGVIGEVLRKLLVDLADPRVDLGEPRHVGGLGLFVALVGWLRHRSAARRVPLLPFGHQVLPLADNRCELGVARGATRCHLRQRRGGLRALRPLRGLEHLARQVRVCDVPFRREAMGRP